MSCFVPFCRLQVLPPKKISPSCEGKKQLYINPRRLSVVVFAQDALTDIIADTGPLHIPGRFLNAAFVAGAGTKTSDTKRDIFCTNKWCDCCCGGVFIYMFTYTMSIRFFSIPNYDIIEYCDFYLSIFTHCFTT